MKTLPPLLITFLFGCAFTPMELRDEFPAEIFVTTQPTHAAAACVARNIEESARGNITGRYQTSIRPGRKPGDVELLGLFQGETVFVADFTPTGSRSNASAWFHPHMLEFLRARIRDSFAGC